MANVLNRVTKEYRASVNDPDYPVIDWIINPDLSAVAGWPPRYWVITGDNVSLMSQAQRDAVDAAELTASRNAAAAALTDTENIQRAFMLLVLDEFNAHTAKMNALLTAIDNAASLAGLKTAVASIADLPVRSESDLRTGMRNKLGT